MADSAVVVRRDVRHQVEIWSTDPAGPGERVSSWREQVGLLFGVSVDAPDESNFAARAVVRNSSPYRFLVSELTALNTVRSRRDLSNSAADHFSIYLQLKGQTVSARGDEIIVLNPGDIGFCDGRRPVRATLGGKCAMAVMPRAMIERRAPWLRNRPHLKLAPDARFSGNLRMHMAELTSCESSLSRAETGLLADSLCNLIALAAAEGMPTKRLQPELQIEALLAYCREHLHDTGLTPQRAADHLGISVRTLHSRFRQIGQTFGRWLLHNRLEGCSVALRDPNQRALNISDVAFRWGFNDLSYFNRAFRSRFDITPGEWRHVADTS
jgi:AraC-like DNA-binding protein